MILYIVIGAAGQGKSPFVKDLINGRACLVFDVQNEYGEKTKYPGQVPSLLSDNYQEPRARYTGSNLKEFVSLCGKRRNTVCVFEEATAFLEGKTGQDVRSLMIGRKHTGNIYVFLFHSINSVPPRIMEMSEVIVLFKTNDTYNKVKAKYETLLPYFTDLRQRPPGSNYIIKTM